MAAHVPLPPGLPQLLKAGTRYFSGLQESLFSHITACRALALCLRTSYGPSCCALACPWPPCGTATTRPARKPCGCCPA
uniref:Uncharacterized protein n=1 Tax=Gopherus agassizii TaxID=38772 RepID=A0A452GPK3_9SAUR